MPKGTSTDTACLTCGYDLRMITSDRCPKCSELIKQHTALVNCINEALDLPIVNSQRVHQKKRQPLAADVSSLLDKLVVEKLEPLLCGIGFRRLKSAFRRRSTEGNTSSVEWHCDSELSSVYFTASIEFKPLSQTLRQFSGFEHYGKQSVAGFGGNWGALRRGGEWLEWELSSTTFETVASQIAEVWRTDVDLS